MSYEKGEVITVNDEDSLMAAMGAVEAGPVSYSDVHTYIAHIDDPDALFQWLEKAVIKNIECKVMVL